MNEKSTFEAIYSDNSRREDLMWHHADPTRLLPAVHASRKGPGLALDIGCGSGVDSVYLAKLGWHVTSIDFTARAVEMAGELPVQESVDLDLVHADILEWETERRFDVIVDAGVLHNLQRKDIRAYRQRILDWLAPDGDFVLVHWESRSDSDRLFVGPRRATRDQIVELFSPDLAHVEQFERKTSRTCNVCEGPRCEQGGRHCRGIGPDLSIAYYWFRRA